MLLSTLLLTGRVSTKLAIRYAEIQESLAIAGRTARCHCRFRNVSNLQRYRAVSLPHHGFLVYTMCKSWKVSEFRSDYATSY